MNKKLASILCLSLPVLASGQTALDAFQLAQPGLKGTARFMSMGGAFTALGGDISSLNQNPAGIGVYRSNDISLTLDLNFHGTKAETPGFSMNRTNTTFDCNNFGYVGAIYTGSDVMPYFNWGASYTRVASHNRRFKGRMNLTGSLSNLIAGYTTIDGWTEDKLSSYYSGYNPYMDSWAPWLSILGYNSYLINPVGTTTQYNGLWQNETTGLGAFDVEEKGYTDEYSIDFGGNIQNTVMWGIGFGITDIDFTSSVYYEEDMENARIPSGQNTGETTTGSGGFGLDSWKHINGTGFNVKFGVIVKPVNELRIGLAVHTPTWYNLKQEGWAAVDYGYGSGFSGYEEVNDGYTDYFQWKLRTPWRLMLGVAGVIGSQGIISLDYEYRPMNKMSVKDQYGDQYNDVTGDIETYYKGVNIVRLGAEYRLTRNWSLRAGASVQSSPTKTEANEREYIYTSGPDDTETTPSYTMDNTTIHGTFGIGYRYNNFYIDAAYVHEARKSTFHPFTASNYSGATPVNASLKTNTNQAILTLGFKF